ncbi:MAG: hypothetical protein KAG10_04810 [Methylococcales bacterium]|nr:hypothetical protein [Methylococcales bacterium]MCK5925195.1 hypothetical protein [Methylococcales bacterium]
MKRMVSKLCALFLLLILTSCDISETNTETEKSAETTETEAVVKTYLNEYPTRDRVKYVLDCVAKHGGLNYINQYACGCKIDKMAETLTFAEFEAANTFDYLRKTPGENGSAFRDPEQSKSLRKRLKEAEVVSEKTCFIK